MAEGEPRASADELARDLLDARAHTLRLVEDLDDWFGPRLSIVNPIQWELGHVAWFQEHWLLREAAGRLPLRAEGDALYDSSRVAHDLRWDLPLPSRTATLAYASEVLERVVELLGTREVEPPLAYFARLATAHEDMHGEALFYTRQTLGHPEPRLAPESESGSKPVSEPASQPGDSAPENPDQVQPGGVSSGRRVEEGAVGSRGVATAGAGPHPGDVEIPACTFRLGAEPGRHAFVHDNEKWAHEVRLEAFRIARAPVSQAEFADFVDDGGYRRDELWSPAGLAWRRDQRAQHPVYWRPDGPGLWLRRHFDRELPLEPHLPVLHVNAHEAEAYCRWAGRRLPSEAEWERAACGAPDASLQPRFPWEHRFGPAAPEGPRRAANLDAQRARCVEVDRLAAGDSREGLRQLLGNLWEWTASPFEPYPGFSADPYEDYSQPWFGTHRVLRGGCFATRARLLRNTWRNFYTPDRRDVFAGFRTAAP